MEDRVIRVPRVGLTGDHRAACEEPARPADRPDHSLGGGPLGPCPGQSQVRPLQVGPGGSELPPLRLGRLDECRMNGVSALDRVTELRQVVG